LAVVVDTETAPPRERFDLWTEASLAVFEPIAVELRDESQPPFSARLMRYAVGPATLYRMWSDASLVRRTLPMIRADDPELIHFMVLIRGRCTVAQEDRSDLAGPNQLISWQSSAPFVIESLTSFDGIIVEVPTLLMGAHADRVCRGTAQRFDGDTGLGKLVRHYLVELQAGLEDGTLAENDPQVAESVVDLVRTVYLRPAADGAHASTADMLRTQIKAHIDAHLTDPELSPEDIARRHFISRSYLDKLFAAEGTSVWESIKAKRLDRCRRDLLDPALDADSIFEIALRWGFVSAPHFSRAFRAAYRVSPRDFRATYRAA
jgi:AraC-like DNA-binding protein